VRSVADDELIDSLFATAGKSHDAGAFCRAVIQRRSRQSCKHWPDAAAGTRRYAVQRWFVANETPEAWREFAPTIATLLDRLPTMHTSNSAPSTQRWPPCRRRT
jgi:hypothetical protein